MVDRSKPPHSSNTRQKPDYDLDDWECFECKRFYEHLAEAQETVTCKKTSLQFQSLLSSIWRPGSIFIRDAFTTDDTKATCDKTSQAGCAEILRLYEKIGPYWESTGQFLKEIRQKLHYYFPQGRADNAILKYAQNQFDAGVPFDQLDWLDLVILFRPFWLRDPASWHGEDKEELLWHLFVQKDAPKFLYREWTTFKDGLDQNWIWQFWLIMIGRGIPLRSRHPRLTNGFQRELFNTPWTHISEYLNPTVVALMAVECPHFLIHSYEGTGW